MHQEEVYMEKNSWLEKRPWDVISSSSIVSCHCMINDIFESFYGFSEESEECKSVASKYEIKFLQEVTENVK